ncbi:unnamed protein product [Clonostachys rosea]|uniref:6-methylsalicylate decarboxylase n=1 Tax=Bionectria ochroleuca TaxID=29856 RepID=A0ABY6TS90_BIOOC|nr:unnamed protein product [Clonostachys rosea]
MLPSLAVLLLSQFARAEYGRDTTGDLSRIDLHSHFIPPSYREALVKYGYGQPDGMPYIPAWSEESHLSIMKDANISRSILSVSSPGTHLVPGDDELARQLTRDVNEFAADLKKRLPDQFGFWASLPLPDVEGSLAELAYALDELNADGVVVMTNAHGVYLGNATLNPIFEELNKRNARVFIHPTSPCIGDGTTTQPASPLALYPGPVIEFFFDTARAVSNLFISGAIQSLASTTFIVSHAGGAFTPLIDRLVEFAPLLRNPDLTAESIRATIKKQFYFDLAGTPFPDQIYGLLKYVDASRLIYGSDYPFTPDSSVIGLGEEMNQELPLVFPDEGDQKKVLRENAEALLK